MYNLHKNAKSCVVKEDVKYNYFDCNIGVSQGENLTPVLLSIFLNEFGRSIRSSYKGSSELSSSMESQMSNDDVEVFFSLFTLLYAYDTVVLSESANDLQCALNKVKDYRDTWKTAVNANTIKIIIFSRGKIRNIPPFTFRNETVNVVDDFIYLGVTFNYNNKFSKAVNKKVKQARRSLFGLLSKTSDLCFPLDLQVTLFDQTRYFPFSYTDVKFGDLGTSRRTKHFI